MGMQERHERKNRKITSSHHLMSFIIDFFQLDFQAT